MSSRSIPTARSPPSAPSTASIPASSACSTSTSPKARSRSARRGCCTSSPIATSLRRKRSAASSGSIPAISAASCRASTKSGLITRKPLAADRRQFRLSLTAKGRQAFAKLNQASQDEVAAMLAPLSNDDGRRLTDAMAHHRAPAGADARERAPFLLRSHRVGDMGWVISRQAHRLRRGIRLGHQLRGAGRRDLRAVHQELRSRARALLDRRSRWRAGRLGLPGEGVRRGRQAAPAAGREEGARARRRPRAGRAMHPRRAREGLREDDAVDAELPARRARHLSAAPASAWSPRRSITASVSIWWARPGRWSCETLLSSPLARNCARGARTHNHKPSATPNKGLSALITARPVVMGPGSRPLLDGATLRKALACPGRQLRKHDSVFSRRELRSSRQLRQ